MVEKSVMKSGDLHAMSEYSSRVSVDDCLDVGCTSKVVGAMSKCA